VASWIDHGLPPGLFVIWATGKGNYEALARYESDTVKVRAYIAPISDAYRAADFALSRAGAMATAELCAWGIPAIVVPLPTAAADHQTQNAKALAAAGAAEMIRQTDLNTQTLSAAVGSMLNDPGKLSRMKAKALERARPTAAADIAAHILRLVGSEQKKV
jgi:UDP-N-acetylglucosamine--N-acetylmuramyl-(pentapeptide) pyrophosphoryl-undecaprenol N-acetylglucosamine transferase